ncbi:MAG: signal transduction histidine kinase [Rhodoglobus sp.]|nr:signal transduction histidine kinase [Rhodoglobus sp.]
MASARPRSTRLPAWSVRARILASILTVAALGMVGAGGTAYLLQRDRVLNQIDDRLQSRVAAARHLVTNEQALAESAATESATPVGATWTARDALESVIAGVIPDRNESSVGILDGRAAFVPGVEVAFHLEEDAAFIDRVVAEAQQDVVLGTTPSPLGTLRYIAAPIAIDGDVAVYVAAIDLDRELADLTAAFTTYAIVALIALLTIGAVGWLVAGRLLDPIRGLRVATSRITASDRHERLPVVGRDDVSDLTRTVNDMLDRLDTALTSQQQLLDDVRHELKTPLTILRGHLELLDTGRVAEVERTRALAIDELDRMTALVDDIEALAESQVAIPAWRVVDAAAFTAEVYGKARGMVGHEWLLGETASAPIELDPSRVTQALLQLVDNAAKYSPAGSTIELGSADLGDDIEFWVSDAGSGIPEGSEDRIFERFGRIDGGRGVTGSGLGLSIVKAIASVHGGSVSLSSSKEGSVFGLILPKTRPSGIPVEEDQ